MQASTRARRSDRAPKSNRADADDDAELSRNQHAYARIKEMILWNTLRPGNKLGHQQLAEMIGVSRTPVREALERLYQEGYVDRIPNRGFYVLEMTSDEARDLYDTRTALELHALDNTMANPIARKDLDRLARLCEKYARLVSEDRRVERVMADRDVHVELAGLSGNRHLVSTLSEVFERLILKRNVEGYWPSRSHQAVEEHAALMDALRARDSAAARAVLRDHIAHARDGLLSYLVSLEKRRF